ncbi:MAG: hypothetical protein WA761_05875, partial [Thermoplasmata archaeon]
TVLDGVTTNATTPILSGPNGSFVWVNLSLVPGISEELTVLSTSGQTLLTSRATASPVVVAQVPSNGNSMITDPYLGLILIAVAATIAAVIAVRLRSRSRLQPRAPPDVDEEATMRRMAEGRAHLLALARTRESFDLDDAVHYWPDASLPSSTELSEWIGALVSEGLLKAVGQPDGPVRFAATEAARKGDEDEEPLSVDLDPELLEEALSQRAQPEDPFEDD